jgi:branched-chain amino acid transport system ATP-binding protein
MSLLEIKGLSKNFSGIAAVNKVSFKVEEGEIVGLIGPNGAGKSTLFALISGFLNPTEGQVFFRGRNITGFKAHKCCRLGLMRTFQIVQVFPDLTVLDNVKPAAFLHARSNWDAEQLAIKALELVGLGNKTHTLAKHLNLSQQKAMEIAKALATKPELVLLDEVMAGLTPEEANEMVKKIKELNKQQKITFIVVEHLLDALMAVSHKVIVLNNGILLAQGTPTEVCKNPEVIEAYLGDLGDESYA